MIRSKSVPVAVAMAIACLVLSGRSQSLNAATISWGTAQNITGTSDVSVVGSLFASANFGTTASGTSVTVNGVTFAGFGVANNDVTSATTGNISVSSPANIQTANFGNLVTPYADLPANYKGLLGTSMFQNSNPLTFTLSNLTIGTSYAIQFWANDPRSNASGRTTRVGTAILDPNTTDVSGGIGQWVLGQFVADATTQSFNSSPAGASTVAYATAMQVRVVPEPATWGLAIAAVGGIAVVRRRLGRAKQAPAA